MYLSSNRKGVHYPRNEWIYSLTSIVHVCSSGLNIVYIPYRYSYTLIIGQEPWLFNMSNRAGWKSRLFQSRARIYFQRDFPAIQASPIGTYHFIIHINRWHYNRAADTFLAIIAIIHSKRHGSFSDRWFQSITNGLVGGWTNPLEKYARQNGFIFPGIGVNLKKYLGCHHQVFFFWWPIPNLPLKLSHIPPPLGPLHPFSLQMENVWTSPFCHPFKNAGLVGSKICTVFLT